MTQNNRTLLIAGNWKMNNDVQAAATLADELVAALAGVDNGVEVLVCPPTIDLTTSLPSSMAPLSSWAPRTSTGRPPAPTPVSPLATC